MSIIENLVTRFLKKGIITHKSPLSPHAWHLRIESEAFGNYDYTPGNFLRIFVGKGKEELSLGDKIRTYSIWNINKEKAFADLSVCTHSEGPGSQWIKEVKAGDEIYFTFTKGNFTLDNSADHYVFIGDLSALGHLYEIHRNLTPGKTIKSIIYSNQEEDFFADVDNNTPLQFYTLPENPSKQIKLLLPALLSDATGKGIVYIGGDSRVCVSLHKYFKQDLGWNVKQIKAKPFWNPEKKGLE